MISREGEEREMRFMECNHQSFWQAMSLRLRFLCAKDVNGAKLSFEHHKNTYALLMNQEIWWREREKLSQINQRKWLVKGGESFTYTLIRIFKLTYTPHTQIQGSIHIWVGGIDNNCRCIKYHKCEIIIYKWTHVTTTHVCRGSFSQFMFHILCECLRVSPPHTTRCKHSLIVLQKLKQIVCSSLSIARHQNCAWFCVCTHFLFLFTSQYKRFPYKNVISCFPSSSQCIWLLAIILNDHVDNNFTTEREMIRVQQTL